MTEWLFKIYTSPNTKNSKMWICTETKLKTRSGKQDFKRQENIGKPPKTGMRGNEIWQMWGCFKQYSVWKRHRHSITIYGKGFDPLSLPG